jgi:hypothetical protein
MLTASARELWPFFVQFRATAPGIVTRLQPADSVTAALDLTIRVVLFYKYNNVCICMFRGRAG